jgi:hypothetical protein
MAEFVKIDDDAKRTIAGKQVILRLSDGNQVAGVWRPDGDYGIGCWGVRVGGKTCAIFSNDKVQPVAYRLIYR